MNPISELMPAATGIMASPMPIIAMLVLCIVGSARTLGFAYLIGWFLGGFGFVFLGTMLQSGASDSTQDPASTFSIIFNFAIAFFLLYLAYSNWAARPGKDDEIKTPGWIEKLVKMSAIPVFGMGFLMIIVNVKNLPLLSSASLKISQSSDSTIQAAIYSVEFSLLASFGLFLPWIITLFGGDGVKDLLERARDWLFRYNNVIMAILFLYLGLGSLAGAISSLG